MRIGEAVLRPVVELPEIRMLSASFVSDLTPADVAPHADWLCPHHYDPGTEEFRLSQHAWLIEANGKRILVDPCVGHQRDRPMLPFYHLIDSPMLERLAALGVEPESIDYVFCTHLHLDHVGWNTQLVDGRFVPTFPNARYLLPRAENDYWRMEMTGELPEEITRYNAGVYAECIQPVIEAGLADMVEENMRIADCLTLIDATGHTIGHMAGVLDSAGEGAVFAGDAIHHPLQVLYPDRPIPGYDPVAGRATRHKLLGLCADNDYWLAPAHFRAPHVCKIRRSGEGYRMEWPSDEAHPLWHRRSSRMEPSTDLAG